MSLRAISSRLAARAVPITSAVLLFLACALPLGWLGWQIAADPFVLRLLHPSRVRWDILARTTGYAAAAAALAVLLAVPVGLALGRRGGGWGVRVLGTLVPVTLLLPSLVYAYGWSQVVRLASPPAGRLLSAVFEPMSPALLDVGVMLVPAGSGAPVGVGPRALLVQAGPADVARCVWALAAWLWPIPALAIAAALRRADPDVRAQALLDGAAGRITFRQMLAPALVGGLAVWLLAGQEFAVYEPTGISVVATEVRMIFETGSFSSASNPIVQQTGGGWTGGDPATGGDANGGAGPTAALGGQDLQARAAAAAVATAGPMLLLTAIVGAAVAWLAGRWAAASGDEVNDAPVAQASSLCSGGTGWKPVLRATAAGSVLLLTVGVPVVAMLLRRTRAFNPSLAWAESGDKVIGSFVVALLAALAVVPVVWAGLRSRPRWGLWAAVATFLVGGQLLAIALIRLYNRPLFGIDHWVKNGPPIMVLAYLGRFAWIGAMAAGATWGRSWLRLREQAATDGADAGRTALYVVGPLAWPLVAGAAVLVLALSLTEVPATVLATPHNPPQIVPMLMTWVHTLENDPMIDASLLLAVVSGGLAGGGVMLVRLGLSLRRRGRAVATLVPFLALLFLLTGCRDPAKPTAVWMSTGTGPGQVVYPRAITYSPKDDTYYLVDRVGRVQHVSATDGRYLNEWQMPLTAQGKPVGVSVGPTDGNVYVPDTHYHRVMVYAPDGKLIREWGEQGNGPGQFIYPTDIAFDDKGHVFVSEYGEHDRVQVFDGAGKYLYEFGRFGDKDGEFARPQSLLIHGDLVYIADSCNHRLNVFKTDGTFVRNMGGVGSELGQFRFPYGLAMDAEGRLVVCEFGNNRVQLVDPATGKGLKAWGAAGREPGQLAYPWAVAVDKRDHVAVVDAGNNRVQIFEF